MLRAAARGFAAGLGWGVLARVFMRLFATNPEFSWAGTLMILGLSAILWAGIAVVDQARRTGRTRWWRIAPVPGLVLFLSPGMVLLPGAVGVALLRSLRSRVLGWLCLVVGMVLTLIPVLGGPPFTDVTAAPTTAWLGMALLVVATVVLGLSLHVWARRWPPRSTTQGSDGAPAPGTGEAASVIGGVS